MAKTKVKEKSHKKKRYDEFEKEKDKRMEARGKAKDNSDLKSWEVKDNEKSIDRFFGRRRK